MRLDEFDYVLPDDLIAQEPLPDRDASRLLCLDRTSGAIRDRLFTEVVELLQPGDLLVMNDTHVSARRLKGRLASGGSAELLVMRPADGGHIALSKPAKKLRAGSTFLADDGPAAEVVADLGDGLKLVRFEPGADLEALGTVPLPPYIHKPLDDEDRYQTVYARSAGSAAAPTAGLHFTQALLAQLAAKGVKTATVTLDVGLDTFRPVQADTIDDHPMHGERCAVPDSTAQAVADCQGRVVAVGTTAVRTLESRARGHRRIEPGEHTTRMLIKPGTRFQIVDGMFTNFHMPRTTMLFLVAALCGREALMGAYAHAVRERYRFLSLGDSMLVL